jgi:hypothetical protein
MKRISTATSIIAQKVDGLKYVRNLNEFKEELIFRYRNGFFNTSFSSEYFRNEELMIQSMDGLKTYLA